MEPPYMPDTFLGTWDMSVIKGTKSLPWWN